MESGSSGRWLFDALDRHRHERLPTVRQRAARAPRALRPKWCSRTLLAENEPLGQLTRSPETRSDIHSFIIPTTHMSMIITATLRGAVLAAALLMPSSAATAANQPVFWHDEEPTVEPRTVLSEKILTAFGEPPYDETIYRARKLSWTGWGTSRAVGRGKITYCVLEYKRCRTKTGTVVVSRIQNMACGDEPAQPAYSRVRWNFPGARSANVEAVRIC